MKSELLQILKPYRNTEKVLKHNQQVKDIIQGIVDTHKQYRKEYDKIAYKFNLGNEFSIGKRLYDFLKKNVKYNIEPDDRQTLRSPSAILAIMSGADCKNYALFIGGVLDAINRTGKKIDWAYRFASYKIFDPEPHHVFVVINPNTDNEIWIDPVLNRFNERKQYLYHKDLKPMALVAVAGIGRKAAKKAAPAVPLVSKKKKTVIKKAAAVLKKGGRVVMKVGAAPSRNAFLLLVKLNVFGLANKLTAAYKKSADKVNRFWSSAGGNPDTLYRTVQQGSKKKRILGSVAIGVPQAAAAVAAATPLLVKIAEILKSIGIDPQDIKKIATDKAQQFVKKELQKIESRGMEDLRAESAAIQAEEDALNEPLPSQRTTAKELIPGGVTDQRQRQAVNYIPIVAVGLAGLYFLTRKN